jgi:TonB family protein
MRVWPLLVNGLRYSKTDFWQPRLRESAAGEAKTPDGRTKAERRATENQTSASCGEKGKMNAAGKLAVLVGLGTLAPFASAKTLEQSYIDLCSKDTGIPVPVTVVTPHVRPANVGEMVDVQFVVDAAGRPSDFSVKSYADSALAESVLAALKQWEFIPAHRNGVPVSMKVDIPVTVVDDSGADYR